jgi:DNA polymerase III sliding clamp (beta) subunit (PCNA family)
MGWFNNSSELTQDIKFVIDREKFNEMVDFVFCVASKSQHKPLEKILFKVTKDKLTLVGLSGVCIAIAQATIVCECKRKEFLVSLEEIAKFKKDSPGDYKEVSIDIKGKEIVFETRYSYKTDDIAGFPQYEEVFPPKFVNKGIVDIDLLRNALNRLIQYVNNDHPVVIFDLSNNNPDITLTASDHKERLSMDYQGQPLTIALNCRYLTDILEKITSVTGKISLEFIAADRPLKLTARDYTCLLLPIKV